MNGTLSKKLEILSNKISRAKEVTNKIIYLNDDLYATEIGTKEHTEITSEIVALISKRIEIMRDIKDYSKECLRIYRGIMRDDWLGLNDALSNGLTYELSKKYNNIF